VCKLSSIVFISLPYGNTDLFHGRKGMPASNVTCFALLMTTVSKSLFRERVFISILQSSEEKLS